MNEAIKISKTNSEDKDFVALIAALDKGLWERYPELKAKYWGNNVIELNPNVIVVYLENKAVACGCFKKYDTHTIELKRMFVAPEVRGLGLGKKVVHELELWARESGYSFSLLETLSKQKEAISLYQKAGYTIVANYDPYVGLENSICIKKKFNSLSLCPKILFQ